VRVQVRFKSRSMVTFCG